MKRINNIIFIDIETVSSSPSYQKLNDDFQDAWKNKASYYIEREEITPSEAYERKAAIYAEFGKIIVISIGYFAKNKEGETYFKVKTLSNKNEYDLLTEFNDIIEQFGSKKTRLCAHNGKEFDYPYLCRRMLISGIPLVKSLQLLGKKPWENPHLDTMEMWRFGDFKYYTSLKTLTTILGLPPSKHNLQRKQIGKVYYQENDIEKIIKYCQKEVIATARVFLKLTGNNTPLADTNIISISN